MSLKINVALILIALCSLATCLPRDNGGACLRLLPPILFIVDATTYHNSSVGMDKASRTLAEGVPPGVPFSFRALADYKEVPHSTAYYRSQGRRSLEQKAQDQQYLTL
jgi:hypothetical protein